jgi:alpha-beta hydrolase superfamily lysophospholipase
MKRGQERSWDRDRLLMDLNKFSFRAKPSRSQEIQKYYDYYDIDFENEIEGLVHRIGWFQTGIHRSVLQTFEIASSKGTIFVFHGYFDHTGIYGHLVRYLLKSGFSVAMYDLPGHGLSSGEPASISSFDDYQIALDACLSICTGKLPGPYHAVGQSTGAAILIDRLVSDSWHDPFDRVILLAPLVRPSGWNSISKLHAAVKPALKVWHRSFSHNSKDVKFLRFIKDYDPLQSKWLAIDWLTALKEWVPRIENSMTIKRHLSIVQGTGDLTVDWKHNISVLRRLFADVKITYVDKGGHHLVNEDVVLRTRVFDLIGRDLGIKPTI